MNGQFRRRVWIACLAALTCVAAPAIVSAQPPATPAPQDTAALENILLGKWKEIGGEESLIEFFPGGTCTYVEKGKTYKGKYKLLDGNRLHFDFGFWYGTMTFRAFISRDDLVLTEPSGEVSKFKRVR